MADEKETPQNEELDDFPDFPEYAFSLFDDFKSKEAPDVYDHMEKEFGFQYNLLGKTMLHRVALINYLQGKKDEGEDVKKAYEDLTKNKSLVMDNFEHFIRPPFKNEKLIWGFMESSDDEAEESLMAELMPKFSRPDVDTDFADPDRPQGDDPGAGLTDPFDMDDFDPKNFKFPEFPKFDNLKDLKLPDFPDFEGFDDLKMPDLSELERLREQMEKLRATDFRDLPDLQDLPDLPEFPNFSDLPQFPKFPGFTNLEPEREAEEP